ncbi:MAG: regulatory iron-sulfur-containing complex subunit RicT [Nitrospirota bacterium]
MSENNNAAESPKKPENNNVAEAQKEQENNNVVEAQKEPESSNAAETRKEPETVTSHTVAGIRFRHCGKIYTFKIDDIDTVPGTRVVVESDMGLSLGYIARPKYIIEGKGAQLKKVVRIANEKDFETIEKNRSLEEEAKNFCIEKAREYKLEMKVVTTETTLDKKRLIIYFTSDGRIDFRELVRDLAGKFKTRIEMRQIGVRDEVKMLGGIGCCGRETCCSLFLTSFAPITIRMAKQQALSINQSKLSGICGRLMCCLGYEYRENGESNARRVCPKKAAAVSDKKKQEAGPESIDNKELQRPAEALRKTAPEQEKGKSDTVPGTEKSDEEKKPGRRRRRRRGRGRFRPDKGSPEKKPQEKTSQEARPAHKPPQDKTARDKSLKEKPGAEGRQGKKEQGPSDKKETGRPFSKRRRFWKKKKTTDGKDTSKK